MRGSGIAQADALGAVLPDADRTQDKNRSGK